MKKMNENTSDRMDEGIEKKNGTAKVYETKLQQIKRKCNPKPISTPPVSRE